MVVAVATLAGRQVELQRHGIAHRRHRRLDRRLGKHRSAKICMEHCAGEIEHGAVNWNGLRFLTGRAPAVRGILR